MHPSRDRRRVMAALAELGVNAGVAAVISDNASADALVGRADGRCCPNCPIQAAPTKRRLGFNLTNRHGARGGPGAVPSDELSQPRRRRSTVAWRRGFQNPVSTTVSVERTVAAVWTLCSIRLGCCSTRMAWLGALQVPREIDMEMRQASLLSGFWSETARPGEAP
jgi:hypothetical protein